MPEYDGIRCIFCSAHASVPKKPEKPMKTGNAKTDISFPYRKQMSIAKLFINSQAKRIVVRKPLLKAVLFFAQ
jgi:hypothetical protein